MDKFQQISKSGARQAGNAKPGMMLVAVAAAAVLSYPCHANGTQQPAAKAKADAKAPATPVCVGEMGPSASVRVAEGKSTTIDLAQLNLPAPAWLRSVGNTDIVQMEPLTSATPRNMFFAFGKKVGATNLMFQNRTGRCALVEVNVGIDTAAVQSSLHELLPTETGVKVNAAADSLVLSGTVSSAGAIDRVMAIAGAFVRKQGSVGGVQDHVVNMMSVGAPQQVMLEVRVAEISRTVLDKIGGTASLAGSRGSWTSTLLSNFAAGANAGLGLTKGDNMLQIDADVKNGLVKILAEPTVMAVSGQDGSFLAGGRIFIPVAQDSNGKVTLEEKEFGVGLHFTPTVLDGGRINLKVAPEVSELSREGVGFTSTATGGNAILPLITTRRAETTVQLFDGQSFAIGGLIKNNVTENIKALPGLGELPVLGALFRSSDFQTDKTELVFIVTPHLVKPLPASYPLPTDSFIPPTPKEMFVEGRMEAGPPPAKPHAAAKPAAKSAAKSATSAGASQTGFELK